MLSKDVFSGTWKLNPAESKFDPNHQPSEATMRFELQEEGYLMTAEGVSSGKPVRERPVKFMLDGKAYPVAEVPGVNYSSTSPNPNTILSEARKGDAIVGQASYVVSEDGSRLTATVRGMDSERRTFQTQLVWDRQAV